ncbi:MAG: zf-HC2 domain-containing protein [Treponema sp.]|nr:zf-HC2 domain-containing protein [Treponema sp.]MCL2271442.1 zf-HC2 domain-containing protein [Treponema sp.]
MCPEPQLISDYMDGELPSPWKEKLESHLSECSVCREKLDSFRGFFNWKHDEQELMEESKKAVWKKLQSRPVQTLRTYNAGVWQRKLSVPLPALAAAAAVVLLFGAMIWVRSGSANGGNTVNSFANAPNVLNAHVETGEWVSLNAYDTIPNMMPASDLNSVLQYLGSDRAEIIIINLPESNFTRSGEPAIIRAADYTEQQTGR